MNTKDDIIKLAREAGFEKVVAIHPDGSKTVTVAPIPELLAFAKLVAAHEREACAAMFDDHNVWDEEVGERIRARGTT
jgi:hypothetical protein